MDSPIFYNKSGKLSGIPNLKGQQGHFFEIVLLVIVGTLFYFFVMTPKISELAGKNTNLSNLNDQLKSITSDASTLQGLSDKLNSNQQDVKLLDQGLPLEELPIRTQKQMNQLLTSSGALVSNVSIADDPGAVISGNLDYLKDPFSIGRKVNPINIDLSLSGTFDQLYDALKKLENYGRIMDVQALSLTSNNDGTLSMKLSLTTYYFGAK